MLMNQDKGFFVNAKFKDYLGVLCSVSKAKFKDNCKIKSDF